MGAIKGASPYTRMHTHTHTATAGSRNTNHHKHLSQGAASKLLGSQVPNKRRVGHQNNKAAAKATAQVSTTDRQQYCCATSSLHFLPPFCFLSFLFLVLPLFLSVTLLLFLSPPSLQPFPLPPPVSCSPESHHTGLIGTHLKRVVRDVMPASLPMRESSFTTTARRPRLVRGGPNLILTARVLGSLGSSCTIISPMPPSPSPLVLVLFLVLFLVLYVVGGVDRSSRGVEAGIVGVVGLFAARRGCAAATIAWLPVGARADTSFAFRRVVGVVVALFGAV